MPGNPGGEEAMELTRRRVLRSATAASVGTAAAGGIASADELASDDFEERDWGYVRRSYEPPSDEHRPVILSMDGYEGATETGRPSHYLRMRDGTLLAVNVDVFGFPSPRVDDEYVLVHASVRGSGCSGGSFDLFDQVTAWDGHEIVEWLADRPWSLDRIGLFGWSYSGMTAFHIAATQPPSLGAMCANTMAGDLYRGLVFPGGVPNGIFTSLWSQVLQPYRSTKGTATGLRQEDELCAQNLTERYAGDPTDDEAMWYTERTYGDTWETRSFLPYADRIEVPTFINHVYQDEQVGPRGSPELFAAISPEPASPPGTPGGDEGRPPLHEEPKRLWSSNGTHLDGGSRSERVAHRWFDYWLLGEDTGIMDEPPVRVSVHAGGWDSNDGTIGLSGYPTADETEWTKFYLREGETLATQPPGDETSDTYVTGVPRQNWYFRGGDQAEPVSYADGPDVLTYRSAPFPEPRVVAGPMTATLHVESTVPLFDLYVTIADQYPDGRIVPLQRGMLRATRRGIDESNTWYDDEGNVVRPHHPHTTEKPVVPGDVNRYHVEVWPLGHLVYPDHRLLMFVTTPPQLDGLFGYEQSHAVGLNTVYHDGDRPSHLMVPLVDWPDDKPVPDEPGCGELNGYRCVRWVDPGEDSI